MSLSVEGLGPLVDLAAAIGLVGPDGQLDPSWFTDPATKVDAMLREPHQRNALLRAADALLGQGQPVVIDALGRHWVPLVSNGGVQFNVVITPGPASTQVAVGASLTTSAPVPLAHVRVLMPLFAVPFDGPATITFDPSSPPGRIELTADVRLDNEAAHPGDVGLQGIELTADILTDGTDPHLGITLQGLQLPGQVAPGDVGLGGAPDQLADQAVALLAGLVQRSVAGASGELAELLALVGISDDLHIPVLPVADLIEEGVSAWRTWLDQLLGSPTAVTAWLGHLAAMIGHGASVVGSTSLAAAAGQPARIEWTLTAGVTVAAVVTVGRTPSGDPTLTLAVEARLAAAGPPVGGLEFGATLARITLGSAPAAAGLPDLHLSGRLGHPVVAAPAELLVDVTAPEIVKVGSLQVGLTLDEQRRPAFVLAAHDVTIAAHSYPVLDLTNSQALADVVGSAVGDLADQVLGHLGDALDAVAALLGVTAPPLPAGAPAWPVDLVSLPTLLADPLGAIIDYHRRVLDSHRDGYVTLLDPLRGLLRSTGVDVAVTGDGTAAIPWKLPIADGLALLVWTAGVGPDPVHLHLGIGFDHAVVDLGGGCPTVGFTLVVELVDLALDGSGGQAVPGVHAALVLGARGGGPLRLGDADTALVADRAGVSLDWSLGGGLSANLVAPGLAARVDGETTQFSLPHLQLDGTLGADVPWRALELLAGHVLVLTGLTWAADLAELAGWRPSDGSGTAGDPVLALAELVADPILALRNWVAALVMVRRLEPLVRRLALFLNGEATPGLAGGWFHGRGTATAPYVLPVVGASAAAAVRAELMLWSAPPPPDVDAFRPARLFDALAPGADGLDGPTLAGMLLAASEHGQDLADALAGRPDLGPGLDALLARWTDSDGVVRAADAVLSGATVIDVPGATAADLATLDLSIAGVTLFDATIIATGPLGPTTWAGIPADHVVDLRTAGLAPEAFDLAAVSAGVGPWLVLLPTRADAVATAGDDGATKQADRLARVVSAVQGALTAAASQEPLVLVGIGAAGHAATAVTARPAGPTPAVLVTVGTPHGGVGLDVLEAQPVAGAVQLLAALLPAADVAVPERPPVTLGRGLLAPLLAAYSAVTSPLGDLTPPGVAPALPDTVDVRCVRGICDASAVRSALAGLVARVLEASFGLASGLAAASVAATTVATTTVPTTTGGAGDVDGILHLGVALAFAPPAGAGELCVTAEVALTRDVFGPSAHPGLRLRIGLGRVGGWLAGGPDPARPTGVSRDPSLRRADIEVDLTDGGTAQARIVLHEATVFGVPHTRWVLSHSDPSADPLLPEAQVVIGRLGAALSAGLAASPAVAQVSGLLAGLGLTQPVTGGGFAFAVDAIRRLLVDPAALLREVNSSARAPVLAAALADVFGAAAPPVAAPSTFSITVDGVQFTVDLVTGAVAVVTAGIDTPVGLQLTGRLDLRADRTLAATLSVAAGAGAGPSGRPIVDLGGSGPGLIAALRWEGAGATFPASVALAPVPDVPALARVLTTVAPAQVLWAGMTFLRSLQPGAVALADPFLTALGLLSGTGPQARVIVPIGLLGDPVHWLRELDPAGLIDAAGALLGLPSPRPGAWTLPYGLELEASTTAGRTTIAIRLDEPVADTGLRVAGSIGIALPTATTPAAPTAELILAVPGAVAIGASGRATLGVGPGGVTARLILPSTGLDLELLPHGPGLAQLGGAAVAAVTYALPLVLDAIVDLPAAHPVHPAAVALAQLGDATGLRIGGRFKSDQIQQLAADPVAQLAQRLRRALPAALDGLAGVLAPAVPAGYSITHVGDELVFTHAGVAATAEVRVAVPDTGTLAAGIRVTASISGLSPFAGASITAGLSADATGLLDAHARFAVAHDHGIDLGPVTLAPVAEVAFGRAPVDGSRLAAGLAVDATHSILGVLRLPPTTSPPEFALEAIGGDLAELLADLLVPIAMDVVLETQPVQDLLTTEIWVGTTVKSLLDRVLFTGNDFDPGALDLDQLWTRLLRLAANVAGHSPSLPIAPLVVATSSRSPGIGVDVYGLSVTLPPGQRFNLVDSDVTIDVEVDDSWITGPAGPAGLTLELLKVANDVPEAFFGFELRGLGLRIGNSSGPLLDTFAKIDSVALHTLFAVSTDEGITDAGGQLELTGLAVAVGSASGGSNKVATGVMRDSASGADKPEPKFSPGLAVQRHGVDGTAKVDLRAGTGDGPWWVSLQRSFGPVYIEQVGFGVSRNGDQVIAARVLIDGQVSLLGLTVAVDDLSLGATWPQSALDPPIYSPAAWQVGLAGLAVSSDTGGVQIAGGLRKGPGAAPDYVGMISIRWSVYGLSAYGGYAVVTDGHGDYTSLFIFGAINAPIGGPPAFFVTGLGAGVGINRLLLLPTDLNQFPSYPLLQALDANSPMADPDGALDQLRAYFPPSRGAFWFAAGVSFTSFALVEGIAVLGIAIGDGLDVNLLGLARAALPTPAFPLVQIELALLVRFSTREGVLWIQAQLTDNSFLLTRDCRLTGGFAYVMWFKGDKAGEFVLTLGGYHPSFHRDGYPVVPRLGFVWGVSDILVIKGESYFALTSEALMAGTRFEASLHAGPLWAYLRLGADAIVYFDPFHFQVTAFAELGAGITIDIDLGWFGHIRITVSINLHANVLLEGPEFRGRATIDLDVASATVSFGNWSDRSTTKLDWTQFAAKYLAPGGAAVLTAIPGRGTLPPSTEGTRKPPTGTSSDPFLVLPEFEVSLTTTAATSAVAAGGSVALPFGVYLAIGPMQSGQVTSTLSVSVTGGGRDWAGGLAPVPTTGSFPKGIWGPQPTTEPKPIPTGDTVDAVNGLHLQAAPDIPSGTVPIDYHQVEVGHRLQLPFLSEDAVRGDRDADVTAAGTVAASTPTDAPAVLIRAQSWLANGLQGSALSRYAAAIFDTSRSAPPQLIPLAYGMAVVPAAAPAVSVDSPAPPRVPVDTSAHPLTVEAMLRTTPTTTQALTRLTVGERGTGLVRMTPATLADVRGGLDERLAVHLVVAGAPAARTDKTVFSAGIAPDTGRAGTGIEARLRAGAAPWAAGRALDTTKAFVGDGGAVLAGEITVLSTGNGLRDTEDARPGMAVKGDLPIRLIALDIGGTVARDVTLTNGIILLPAGTDRVVLIGGSGAPDGAAGWHSTASLLQISSTALIAPGATVSSSAVRTRRGGQLVATAFVPAAQAVGGYSVVTTRLPIDVRSVAVVLETADRTEGDRGDDLELGLAGVRRTPGPTGAVLPPAVVVSGSRTVSVYAVEPIPVLDAAPAAVGRLKGASQMFAMVTVATGEHVHLAGVLGTTGDVHAFVAAIRERGVAGAAAHLVTAAQGSATVRWLPQGSAPEHDEIDGKEVG